MRLNKFIAQATGISRREADEKVRAGKVTINGSLAVLGAPVADQDKVLVDDLQIRLPEHFSYLLLNKPIGHTTTRKSQDGTPTVYDLLPEKFHKLKYVGRLDKDSSGLLLLTDDGDFTHQMTHPNFGKQKVYEVALNKSLNPQQIKQLGSGLKLEDGVSALAVSLINGQSYKVVMAEGRNRQIRRTFEAMGLHVNKLHRTHFGNYKLGDLASGKFIEVKKQ